MGFFNNYDRPGAGISKNQNETVTQVFFGVLGRKFFKFMQLGIMHCLLNLPLLMIYIMLYPSGSDDLALRYIFSICALLHLATVGLGFFAPGFVYVLRNFSREEHAYVMSDFFGNIKDNFRQSFVVFLIDTAMTYIFYLVLVFYFTTTQAGAYISIARFFVISLALFYVMMHFYIYQIMVTFKMPLRQIFKNSFILTVVFLPQNTLILLAAAAVSVVTFFISIPLGVFVSLFFSVFFIGYITTFFTQRIVKKYTATEEEE